MKYFYLDREKAKEGITLVFLVSEERKEDYKKYFEGAAIEFTGEDIPHFITYLEETDTIREATEEEKLERGQRPLYDNETVIDGKIVEYNPHTQKVVEGQLVEKTRDDYIGEGIITLDSEKEKARTQREKEFLALDILDAKVAVGRDSLTAEEKQEIDIWYETWKELPNNYVDINTPIEGEYPDRPSKVDYYYKGE